MGFLSDIVGGITGEGAADASKDAAELQYQATQDSIEFQRDALAQQQELNQPYIDLGQEYLPGLTQFFDNPLNNTAQTLQNDPYGANYLSNNPLFQASIDNAADQLKGTAAAQGKLNSGGLVDQLFQNYLATGDQYYGNFIGRSDSTATNQLNRLLQPIQLGQNSANFQGTNIGANANNISELTGQGANALGAGKVGAANAYAGGAENLLNIGAMIYGMCDHRAKDIIEQVDTDTDGLGVYRFTYKGDDVEYIGKMAQDIATIYPQDVVERSDGMLMVNSNHFPRRVA